MTDTDTDASIDALIDVVTDPGVDPWALGHLDLHAVARALRELERRKLVATVQLGRFKSLVETQLGANLAR